jgi:DNA repair protein RadC
VLELLLFQLLPYKDTNKIAHDLLNVFGSIQNVMYAPADQLKKIRGISEVTAVNIALHRDLWLRCREREDPPAELSNALDIIQYAQKVYRETRSERMHAVYVDFKARYLSKRAYAGTTNSVDVTVRRFVADALQSRAAGVILLHGHFKGTPQPSAEDIKYTADVITALKLVEIELLDHLIFNETGEFYSFRQHGYITGGVDLIDPKYTENEDFLI